MKRALIFICLLTASPPAWSTPASHGGLEVEAETLEWDETSGALSFSGKVRLKWGDVELRCQSLRAKRGEKGALSEVVAQGGVTVTGPNWSASSGQAQYEQSTDALILTEMPIIERQGAEIKAKRIILHIESRRLVLEGAKGLIPSPEVLIGLLPEGTQP